MEKKKTRFGIAVKIVCPIVLILAISTTIILNINKRVIFEAEELLIDCEIGGFAHGISNTNISYDDELGCLVGGADVFKFDGSYMDRDYLESILENEDFLMMFLEYSDETHKFELIGQQVSDLSTSYKDPLSPEDSQKMINERHLIYDTMDGKKYLFTWYFICEDPKDVPADRNIRALGFGMNIQGHETTTDWFKSVINLTYIGLELLAVAVVILIISKFIKDTKKLSIYVNDVKSDSLPEDKLQLNRNDELGQMADSINNMVDGLKVGARMSDELSVATKIQSSLLISNFDALNKDERFNVYAKMTPAKEVGGDLYDVIPIGDDKVAIIVGDVSDKGVPAAIFMSRTISLIASSINAGLEPAEVLANANEALHSRNPKDMFVTCFVGILDLKTGELRYSSAGHNPPMLKKAGGSYEVLEVKKALVLGLFDGIKYETKSVMLSKDSKILVYTDGVTEAENEKEDIYEDENRFVNFLEAHKEEGPEELIENLQIELDNFKGNANQFDDITMLMLEYIGEN